MQWIIISIILLITAMFLFPPGFLVAHTFSEYAIHWMLFCLLVGVISLFLGSEKLMYSCFFSSGIIAFFLMNSFNTDLKIANLNSPAAISLMLVNLNLSSDSIPQCLNTIYETDPDIIVLEELLPEHVSQLQSTRLHYPYQSMLPRVDALGKAVLSKFPFYDEFSFGIFGNPILNLGLTNKLLDSFNILVANTPAPSNGNTLYQLNTYLDSLGSKINQERSNVILAANFNRVPWSREIRNFKLKSILNSSRRDNNEGISGTKTFSILNTPNSEIFYSKSLECSYFKVILDSEGHELGLYGRYQKRVPF